MPDASHEARPHREVEELSFLGQLVWFGAGAAHLGARVLDHAAERAAGLVADTEKAFRQGRDGVEDAKVLEEWDERR